jgi:hypothetical protein
MIFFGRDLLQHAIAQFMSHYHAERNRQGLENNTPARLSRRRLSSVASERVDLGDFTQSPSQIRT